MSRIIVQAEGFVNSIPVNPRTPGVWAGTGRADVISALFSLATEKGLSVDMSDQHWPTIPATPEVMRVASNKMSRGWLPRSERKRHGRRIGWETQ